MEQWIRDHFREAQRIVVILEKPTVLVVKMAKNLLATRSASSVLL
jgi:trans-aconitate methyltransferase